jgi:PKD repeat protein
VDDGSGLPCASASDTLNVSLSRQPTAVAGEDVLTDVGSSVSFDGSASHSEDNANLDYLWDFGDGSQERGVKVTHAYKKGGKYLVLLSVSDGKGKPCSTDTDSLNVRVNTQPSVSLDKVRTVCQNTDVLFDASGSSDADGNALKYTWDFGDGTVLEGPSRMTHAYREGGEYTVTVTVDDQVGTAASGATQSIKVRVNRPPIADAGPNLVCCINKVSEFDASASSDPDQDALTYLWDFGDGTTAKGKHVSHKYTKMGKYKVVLTVKDDSGTACDSAVDSFEAMVSDKPVSIMEVR